MKPNIFLVRKEELTVGIPIVFSSGKSAMGKAEPFIRLSSDNRMRSLFLHRKYPPHTEFDSNGGGRIATAGKIVRCKGRENVSGRKYAKNTSKNILMGLRHQEIHRTSVVIGVLERQSVQKIQEFVELPSGSYHLLKDKGLVVALGKVLNLSGPEMVVLSFQDTLSGELILFSADLLEIFIEDNKFLKKI